MVSDTGAHPTHKPVRKRGWRALVFLLAALALALSLGMSFLLNADRGAQFVFRSIETLSKGTVQTAGVKGSLRGPLHLDRLSIDLKNQKITLEDIRLDWRPAALLGGKLHVTSLKIGKLGFLSKIDQVKEAAVLPDSIAPPVHLQIDKVQVAGGDIAWGPLKIISLGAFSFNLDFDGAAYTLNLEQFSAHSTAGATDFSADVSGKATLATAKPYALNASLLSTSSALAADGRSIGGNGRVDLHGSLAEIAATVDLHIDQASLQGNALLRPFSEQILGAATLSGRSLNLASLKTGLPLTAFNIALNAKENGSGTLSVTNSAAGLYNENRLPLNALAIDFAQKDAQFNVTRIAAELGSARRPAGRISGNGRYADGALALLLQTGALDLQKLDGRVRATALAGKVEVKHADGRQAFTIVLSEPLKKNRLTLNAHATIADAAVSVDRVELRAGASAMDASAQFALSGNQHFNAKGIVRTFHLRDFGNFPQLPELTINGEFAAQGLRQPALAADASFRIRDSRLAGNPLAGEGQMQLRAGSLIVPTLSLRAGANRISAQGKLAESNSRITFAVDAPSLEQFGADFAGAVHINGEVLGSLQRPRIIAAWKGNKVRTPNQIRVDDTQGKADITIDRASTFLVSNAAIDAVAHRLHAGEQQLANLNAHLQFAQQPNAPLSITVRGDGIAGSPLRAQSFSADVTGTTARHALNAALIEDKQSWNLRASGSLQEKNRAMRWQGTLDALDAKGRFNARLNAPAPLLISRRLIQLDQFRLNADYAYIAIEQFIRNDDGIATRGKFEQLQIGELLHYLQQEPLLSGDLKLGGAWDLKFDDALSGHFSAHRESGDAMMRGNASIALGLSALSADASVSKGRVALKFLAEGKQLGRIDAGLDTTLGDPRNHSRFSIAPHAPVSSTIRINTPSLAWLGPLLSPSLVTEGSLQGDIAIKGTFDQPRFAGQIAADKLRLLFTDTGVDLKQGSLRSEFQGDRLLIRALTFQNDGALAITGPIGLSGQQITLDLALKAARYKLLDRSDRKLVISGDSVVGWREGSAKANGKFTVDSGFIDISATDMPELSDDVVVVGRNTKQAAKTAIALDLEIALGKGIHLRGRGLDARLVGEIRLLASAGDALRAQGTLRVASGTFKAYGRELAIEQGLLRFNGALNNPALDILAMRRGQEVEAGVSVRGTVLTPRITLVSEPTVPDAEKLSWLVLGRSLSGVGNSEMGTLQSAAGALLAQGAAGGLQAQIATAFGLDDFSVGADESNLQQRIVTLGKKISSRLYVSYRQGLENASSVLLLRYTLTKRISVEAEAGTRSALSIFYNFVFD